MVDTVIIDTGSNVVSVQDGNSLSVSIAHTVSNVEVTGNDPVAVVSVGQMGPAGAAGPQGPAGSGIDAQSIQGQPVSAAVPNENNILAFHSGTWIPESLNGGNF